MAGQIKQGKKRQVTGKADVLNNFLGIKERVIDILNDIRKLKSDR